MSIKVKLNTSKIDALLRSQPEVARAFLSGVAQGITDDIVESFNTSPPGRSYKRGSVTHVASVAGYPPNVDLGTLRASMHWHWRGDDAVISDGVEYGIWLEEGTTRIAPRPFFVPVFEDWKNKKLAQYAKNFRWVV